MATLFKDLTEIDKEFIVNMYEEADHHDTPHTRATVQEALASKFGVSDRSIRNWAKRLLVAEMPYSAPIDGAKILIYDIETPLLKFWGWWSGNRYVNGNDLVDEPGNEPRIITVAWKWFGTDKVYHLTWDKDQCDKKLMQTFLKDYNSADLVVGVNNDNFDNRWITARAMKFGLEVNKFLKSLDIQKQAKKLGRLPSYALKYLCKHFGVTMKLQHEGRIMWIKVQTGTKEERKEYMEKMIVYNVGDIISTEEVMIKMLPYMDHKIHLGVLAGNDKFSCPNCGETEKLSYIRDTVTKAGTIQRIMKCNSDNTQYKISNREYLNWKKDN